MLVDQLWDDELPEEPAAQQKLHSACFDTPPPDNHGAPREVLAVAVGLIPQVRCLTFALSSVGCT